MSIEQIKKLREETGIGISECKEALEEAKGDVEKAKEILKKRGKEIAISKSMRQASQGMVSSYIHVNNRVGVLIEVRCESDFVAKSEKFQDLVRDISMQIAAMNPSYISQDAVPEELIAKEKEIYAEQVKKSGKPVDMTEKIVQGKLEKWYGEVVLLNQKWIKDDSKKIQSLIDDLVSQLGEKIEISNFARFEI